MKTTLFFVLLSVVCLAQSNAVGRSYEGNSASDNLVDSDLSNTKLARIVNNDSSTELAQPAKGLPTEFFLPIMGFLFKFLLQSKLTIVHLFLGMVFGIVGTVVACNSTPFCHISAGPEVFLMEPISEFMSPDNVDTMIGYARRAMDVYDTVQKLN